MADDKVLSQNEVDALLGAVKSGTVAVETKAGDGKTLETYDFSKQRKLVRSKMPGLKIVYDRFQRIYRQTLSSFVRSIAYVEASQTEMLRYSEWSSQLPNPTCMSIVRLSPLIGQCIVQCEPDFIYSLIDWVMGGGKKKGQNVKANKADFTQIEAKMVEKMVKHFTKDLEKAWQTFYELQFEFVRTEINPEYVSIVSPSDVVIVTSFNIKFEDVNTNIQFIIPLFALDPVKNLLSDHTFVEQSVPNPNWKIWIGQSVEQSRANLRVLVGETEVTMREVFDLKPGDVIQLDRYVGEDIPIYVEGVKKFGATIGSSCGQCAVRVTRSYESSKMQEETE